MRSIWDKVRRFPAGSKVRAARQQSTEDYLLATLREPIAVVGNGKLPEIGGIIDGYASVIRINLFTTTGFEPFCGAKTTHWCVRFHVELPQGGGHLQPFTPYARADSRRFGGRDDILFCQTSMVRRLKARAPAVTRRFLGFTSRKHVETTGFALTVLLMDLGFRPTLFGMDGLATGHYFDLSHQHWSGHEKRDKELEYLDAWGVRYPQIKGDAGRS
ncbi:MAG: hypothetical protein WCL44_05750 [bacterium]